MEKYLVVMEVSQKQNYIFKTNRLAEQIGASIAIREVTETLPKEYAPEEFVFAGGGKSVFEFDSEEQAKRFIKDVSTAVLREYPGMELFMALNEYDEISDSVIEAINRLYRNLEGKKSSRKPAFRFYGSGLTEQCSRTQLPAVTYDEREGYLSAESLVKLTKARKSQDKAFEELLPDKEKYRFAKEFSELGGTSGVKDYIAVVVLDGNKMGKKIEKFKDTFNAENEAENIENFNLKYKKEFRKLSEMIDDCYRCAVRHMIDDLAKNYDVLVKSGALTEIGKDRKRTVLPIRPLILAGDDICFVTDVRIGISLTERLMKYVEETTIMDLPMRVCAGIAMVKTSYPFFRAHELAEELCHNSKGILPADDSNDESVLDFHLVQGEIEGSITDIRREKYNKNTLTSKPFYLQENDRKNSLSWFKRRLALYESGKFTLNGEIVEVGKGVLKEYRDALSAGEEAAKKYRIYKRLEDVLGDGYENGRCLDFDVIEMLGICKWLVEEV